MALYLMVFMGGTPLGGPLIGWLGETFGARWGLIGGGAATIVGTLACVAAYTWTRRSDRPAAARAGVAAGRSVLGRTA
jgi:MFS family permease